MAKAKPRGTKALYGNDVEGSKANWSHSGAIFSNDKFYCGTGKKSLFEL